MTTTIRGGADDVADVNHEALRQAMDSYGVAVRAGAITPQTTDENHFRGLLKIPAASGDVARAWKADGGVRRPITLLPPRGEKQSDAIGDDENSEDTDD